MFEDIETHKKLSKWIIGTFTACILIYLGIRHISHVADAVMWLKDLLNPLLIGLILSRLVDTFISRISLTMLPVPNPHNTVCVLSWEEARHWQSRSSGYSNS